MLLKDLINYKSIMDLRPHEINQSFENGQIATSDCNNYMPFYVLSNHVLLDVNGNFIVEYKKPHVRSHLYMSRRYNDFFSVQKGIYQQGLTFKLQGIDHTVFGGNNVIYDRNQVLVCLGIRTQTVLDKSYEELASVINPEDYVLVVNNNLFTELHYRNFSKKVKKEYIDNFAQLSVDIVYTNNIDNWFFKNNFKKPNFTKATDMVNHLHVEVPRILLDE